MGESFCASESDSSRLVTVQSQAEQTALEEYLSRQNAFDLATLEYLWLDGRDVQYDPHLPQQHLRQLRFSLGPNERKPEHLSLPLTFTNWAAGQPAKPLENPPAFSCTPIAASGAMSRAQRKCRCLYAKAAVVAGKGPGGGRETEIIELFQEEGRQIKKQMNDAREIEKLTKNPVPIGFIYVQLPKEKSPQEIWSSELKWTDISTTYESIFFRVAGNQAAAFGTVQEEFFLYDEVTYDSCERNTSRRLCKNSSFPLNGTLN
ncbi:hypothetical protein TYRP_001549 [Tyrophagus putrescentiae]|nr:hypothetical protein TYRP_001549 [Tyrophagus putrescentiae]